jgi:uncharacterized protein YkwD
MVGYNVHFVMNFVRLKRLTMHFFIAFYLLIAVTTPVFAVTVDLASPNASTVMPLSTPVALKTPTPTEKIEAKAEDADPSPTPKKAADTPTPSPTEEPSPTLTATPSPTQAPTTLPLQTSGNTSTGGLNADVLFNMSNDYRAKLGLPPFQTDARVCSLAQARAPEIAAEIAGGYMHAGKDRHNFPYWFTENIIEFRTEAEAFNWWINDHIHRVQIEAPNTHSCVACSGNACVQHFTSFKPK